MVKLKKIVEYIQQEASLTGNSRSGNDTNWNYYIVRNFDPAKEYFVEKDTPIFSDDLRTQVGNLTIGSVLTINSTELKQLSNTKFANVTDKTTGTTGFVPLAAIRKPTTKGKTGVVGGTTSKEFLPTKLKLTDKMYENKDSLIADVIMGMESVYGDAKYSAIREYAIECMNLVAGKPTSLSESYSRSYQLSKRHEISDVDIKILSKNFGEVLAAIYVISTNKKSAKVFFPSESSNPLYDFVMIKKNGMNEYYSVKSHGGSSTSLSNLNFLLKNFSEDNALLNQYETEIQLVRKLMNDKVGGKTTLTNIESFFSDVFPDKTLKIVSTLNRISKVEIRSLSQLDLNSWFNDVTTNSTEENFLSIMSEIYENILDGSATSPSVLKQMFSTKKAKDNGYLYYPMGSYIVQYLNDETKPYLKVLNILLNYGSYIHQFDVNLSSASLAINISNFGQSSFRFSYNGMSNAPANRPIGFVKAGKAIGL